MYTFSFVMTTPTNVKEIFTAQVNTHTHGFISRKSANFLKKAYEQKLLNKFTLMNVMDLCDCGYNMAVAVIQELNAFELVVKARRGLGIYMGYLTPEEYIKLCDELNKKKESEV